MLLLAAAVRAGTFSTAPWTGDASSDIRSGPTLWAYHFGAATDAIINGVTVTGNSAPTASNANFDLTGTAYILNDDANNLTDPGGPGSAVVARDFVYGGSPAVVTVKKLVVGTAYTVSFLSVGWDASGRTMNFASGTDSAVIDQDEFGYKKGIRVDYTFTATAVARVITLTPTPTGEGTWHFYGIALRPQITVTNTNDSGAGSLRQALGDAAAAAGPDTIAFAPNLSGQTITLSDTIRIFDTDVTIDGSGVTAGVTITVNNAPALLSTVNSSCSLTLKNLTLTGGNASAIDNYGTLTVTQCTLSGNSANSSGGGAIYNRGTLTVTQCTLSGNNSSGGGAILNYGTLALTQCTLSGNNANSSGGGAILNYGTLALTQCTLSGNSTNSVDDGGGGAIRNNGTLALTRCTLSGNSAPGAIGGAIDNRGTLALTHCTLSGNNARAGGAILNAPNSGGTLTLTNSIVAGNTSSSYYAPDIYYTSESVLTPTGVNFIGNTSGSGLTANGTTLLTGDSLLAPLGNYGGPTNTMPPLPGSPAIDAATVLDPPLSTDQRGVSCPQWGASDIGAVEASLQADCAWEVREVWSSNIASVIQSNADADAALADPAAQALRSTAAVINFSDPDTNPGSGGFFGSELPYPADDRTAQGLVDGNDDNFALLAHTYITITDEDDYTFGFSSDDGARLRLYAATGGPHPSFISSTRLNTANPANPAHSGNTLTFDAQTGNADTLGVVHLTAGTYGVEFLSWERAYGAHCEVFLARGARTAVDGNFRLLGDTGRAQPLTVGTLGRLGWRVESVQNVNTFGAAIAAVTPLLCAPAPEATPVPVPVTALRFTSANDSPERDPMTFVLEGSNGTAQSGPWITVASGLPTNLSTARLTVGAPVSFPNSTAYNHYQLRFPTVRNADLANSMQIAEVEFLAADWLTVTSPGDPVIPSSGNHPGPENAANAIDESNNKYLNFDKLNAGFAVSPKFAGQRVATLNYYDPQNGGGGGHGLPQAPFPGNTAADDDNFALGARATITIPRSGEYTFNVLGDDSVRFRLLGSRGWTVSGRAGATALIDGFTAPDCCADTLGQVRLVAGTYQIEVIYNEIRGGAYLGVWAAQGRLTAWSPARFSLVGSPAQTITAAVPLARTPGLTRPANDDFAAALPLSGDTARAVGCNQGGTMEFGEPADFQTKSVWWTWTAPTSGTVQVDTIGSSFDTVLAVLTGSTVGALTQVALDHNGGGDLTSKLTFTATAATVYRIQVSGLDSTEGTIRLSLGRPPTPPANDAFASATDLGNGGALIISGTNAGATKESGEPDHAGQPAGSSVWFTWMAPVSGRYIVDTGGSDFDTLLAVSTGTAVNALSSIASNNDVGVAMTSRLVFAANAGTTYRLAVDGWEGRTGSYFLTIVPGLSDLPDLTVLEDSAAPAPIAFTVGDPARQTTEPVVTAVSSNQALLPNADLLVSGTGCSARTLTLPAPAANANGTGTATITVSTTVDGVEVSDTFVYTVSRVNAPVSSTSDSGPGSLRQALLDAASLPGPDTITFPSGFTGPVTLSSELVISDTGGVTIDGSGVTGGVTITGDNATRLFTVNSGGSLTLMNLTLTGGNAGGNGGAILNHGTLALTRCTLSGNTASGGGALANDGAAAAATLSTCTIAENTAIFGGGIFSQNAALSLRHCTVARNTGTAGTGGIVVGGGTATLENSIVALNSATGTQDEDLGGAGTAITASGANVIGNHSGSYAGVFPADSLAGTFAARLNPLLAPLASYGGPTKTMALLPGSPARDAATVTPTAATDQRGFPIIGTPDIGAYEAGTLAPNYNAYIWETLPTAGNNLLTDPLHAAVFDYDFDGQSNGDEWNYLTDAASAGSRFLPLFALSGGNMDITFPTAAGRTYSLQRSDDLTPGSWTGTGLPAAISGDGSVKRFTVPATSPARRFFRLSVSS